MPVPEGWEEETGQEGQTVFKNLEMNVETEVRPQTLICRNLYQVYMSHGTHINESRHTHK